MQFRANLAPSCSLPSLRELGRSFIRASMWGGRFVGGGVATWDLSEPPQTPSYSDTKMHAIPGELSSLLPPLCELGRSFIGGHCGGVHPVGGVCPGGICLTPLRHRHKACTKTPALMQKSLKCMQFRANSAPCFLHFVSSAEVL